MRLVAIVLVAVSVALGAVGLVAVDPFAVVAVRLVSGASSLPPSCVSTPNRYRNSEAEARVAVSPRDPNHLVGVWQQDRRDEGGGADANLAAVSRDGGLNWRTSMAPFSHCTGGNRGNNGDFERVSDPWITIAPNGDVYQLALVFQLSGTAAGMSVSKSTDGGETWSAPTLLSHDLAPPYSDKGAITADPNDPNFVYVVWSKCTPECRTNAPGSWWISRTIDGGRTWEPERLIFDPTSFDPRYTRRPLAVQVVVLPDGTVINVFNLVTYNPQSRQDEYRATLQRSRDRGRTWGPPIDVGPMRSRSVSDPETGEVLRVATGTFEVAVDRRNGTLYGVWQDGRFSSFEREDIAFVLSGDGGRTWTPPIRVNRTPAVTPLPAHAFTPVVAVNADGAVAVYYSDLRNNVADGGRTLPTDNWLVHCHRDCTNPDNWTETHVSGPYDTKTAPRAGVGLFVGDYQGLVASDRAFIPFFVQTNSGNTSNRTDVFAAILRSPSAPAVPTPLPTPVRVRRAYLPLITR